MKFVKSNKYYHPKDIERDKYVSSLIISMIELSYVKPTKMSSMLEIELLQKEIEYFKKVINYDDICQEIDEKLKNGVEKIICLTILKKNYILVKCNF